VNRILGAFDDGGRVTFLDINARLLEPDGTLSREIMPDLLHPKEKGYQIWAEAMEPFVAGILGAAPAP
jgi:beta-glucosidase